MKHLIYDPKIRGPRLTILCFISGSGTNYQKIFERDPNHDYVVFTNRPGCEGILKARANKHITVELSHEPFFKGAKEKYGGIIPRNCPEREYFEEEVWRRIERRIEKTPDLICLAGYDLVFTDWSIDIHENKIINVHPGDTAKGYIGLHWIPTAKAILAGEEAIRSTLFLADKGLDTGPVLVQSKPLDIIQALDTSGRLELGELVDYIKDIKDYKQFATLADTKHKEIMKRLCEKLQAALKIAGDWQIYPFAVHDLIAKGRVALDGRTVLIDNKPMPAYGYRMDEQ